MAKANSSKARNGSARKALGNTRKKVYEGIGDGAQFAQSYLRQLRQDPDSVSLEGYIDDVINHTVQNPTDKPEGPKKRLAFANAIEDALLASNKALADSSPIDEKSVWFLESALYHVDELICGELAEEDREHYAQAVQALLLQVKANIQGHPGVERRKG